MDGSRVMFGTPLRKSPALAIAVLLASLSSAPALADKRVALVIGNSAYKNVNQLPNPSKDAAAIGEMLKKAGFDSVDSRQDIGVADMKKMIRDFSDKVADADVAVVFYAGHGIEVDGTNYVLPIDTKLERDIDVEDEAVSLDRIVKTIEPAKKLRLVILDACRDNPFATTMKRSIGSRGIERGLAKVEPANPNTLIAYAAKAGSTASDGAGSHSPFTTALLVQLPVPGQDLRKSLGYVRDSVLKETSNKQEPFVYGSLGGDDVALVAAPARAATVPAQVAALDPDSKLRQDYELAAAVNTKPAWDAFINNYPKGFYADLARAARSKLDSATANTVVASKGPDSRGTQPVAQPPKDANPYAGFENFTGKTFKLNYVEDQQEVSPAPGLKHVRREIVIYVKSAAEISSRLSYVRNDPAHSSSRYALGALGDFNRGVQMLYSDSKLHQVTLVGSYRLLTDISSNGTSCQAKVVYELNQGKDHFEMRNQNGDPVNVSALSTQNIACKVAAGEAMGTPPETVGADASNANPAAKAK
ncbi:MAG: caspase family protein [Rhizobiales bacterium]|nr:caspase family protein [Hyphomicrobiales bacterium]